MARARKIALAAIIITTSCSVPSPKGTVQIDLSKESGNLPVSTLGVRILPEEVPGNLSAELVRGQDFEEGTDGWAIESCEDAQVVWELTRDYPMMPTSPTSLMVTLPEKGKAVIRNTGFGGMAFKKGGYYYFRLNTAKGNRFDGELEILLKDGRGRILCDRPLYPDRDSSWCEYTGQLTSEGDCDDGLLEIEMKGKGTLYFDYVSLMPFASFNKRIYGMREDAGEALAELSPGFVRWDGGDRWKLTEGDPKGRVLFGIQEFFELSEDIGADAHLGFRGKPLPNDVTGAAEYARGDGTTFWSRQRILQQREEYPLALMEADEPYAVDVPYGVSFVKNSTIVIPTGEPSVEAALLCRIESKDTLAVPESLFGRGDGSKAILSVGVNEMRKTVSYNVWKLFNANRPDVSLPATLSGCADNVSVSAGIDTLAREAVIKIVNQNEKRVALDLVFENGKAAFSAGTGMILHFDSGRIDERTIDGDKDCFPMNIPPTSMIIFRTSI